ncbi:hypothetical protein C731_3370 [Mycolicibacterium hassiacum DSM 44199]|jgi:hypothetical protein|uniref:Uncharacterized protein n=1 Tax=Mycolicibacterium hassiacum (strain DSM 44199 / CIP 105218 / JCM 12690 / 3849) TaxID=1122247 RepID=K5BAQ1_MYCHD|nr:hypothetical protein [Mycolicibacterium hassiacum]EKF22630.1 hypothetical protein C731_3370 [Mycolicibacterium hassiacum DSM 44199]MBX5489043.1 hypothetical protein [Mycolicibacterium hassiacum]MDA4088806.1 hypothetical protein [Mycolicibacterium hassiacum DSM 44199]PZN19610.1 MAG: hypothetical protein DIU75_14365 [Mycolicibacterium hassiacum]VCT91537.1 hypothetical protein MHAS_03252 [Mycolicibacterium hassiacum DSM 44199]
MDLDGTPFIGTEALAAGALTRYELRRYYRAPVPNVYIDKRVTPSLRDRTVAAWLWTGRDGVVAGRAAAALHGVDWIDDTVPVELIWANAARRRVCTPARRRCSPTRCCTWMDESGCQQADVVERDRQPGAAGLGRPHPPG